MWSFEKQYTDTKILTGEKLWRMPIYFFFQFFELTQYREAGKPITKQLIFKILIANIEVWWQVTTIFFFSSCSHRKLWDNILSARTGCLSKELGRAKDWHFEAIYAPINLMRISVVLNFQLWCGVLELNIRLKALEKANKRDECHLPLFISFYFLS